MTLALLLATASAPVLGQGMYQPVGVSDADALAMAVRRVGSNPLDLDALLTAGELSVRLEDLTAAGSFFVRAGKIDPRSGRAKAGEGAILVRSQRPAEAMRYFATAELYGLPAARFAGDRGLAWDLLGDPGRAHRDYKLALASRPDAETRRRYAMSLAIAGRQAQALDELAPLIRQNDRAAWRTRAFVLALSGDAAEASRIAQTMMPPGAATGLSSFFAELPRLSPIDRAFAVHFGETRPSQVRLADARLAPRQAPLALEPLPVRIAAARPAPAVEPKRNRRDRDRDNRDWRDRYSRDRDGEDRDRQARDRRDRDRREPVQLATVPPPPVMQPAPQPPAYQAPLYQPPSTVTAMRDRPLSQGELASLTRAGLRNVPRTTRSSESRGTSVAPVNGRALTQAEQASLAAATIRPRGTIPAPLRRDPVLAASAAVPMAVATRSPVPRVGVAPQTSLALGPTDPTTTTVVAPIPREPVMAPVPTAAANNTAVANALAPPMTLGLASTIISPAPSPAAGAARAPTPGFTVPPVAPATILAPSTPVPTVTVPVASGAPVTAMTGMAAPEVVAPQPPVAPPLAAVLPAPLAAGPQANGDPGVSLPAAVVATPSPVAASPSATIVAAAPTPLPVGISTSDAPARPVIAVEPASPAVAAAQTPITTVAPVAVPTAVVSTPLAPLVARVQAPPVLASRRSRLARGEGDTALSKIVAGLTIPASELDVAQTGPQRTAARRMTEAKSLVDRTADKAAADKKALAEKKAVADRKAAQDKKAASDKKVLAEKKDATDKKAVADKAAAAEKKLVSAEPKRIWVQVAGGANEGDLIKAWRAASTKAPDALSGRRGYTTPLRATNRVLTGPFKTDAEARAHVNQLAKAGVSAFTFTSEPGQKITRLDAK
jgi:hypothetical protein